MTVALFAPCFVDQFRASAAIAALRVLERLGVDLEVPSGAACCGQPPANAGFEDEGAPALQRFVRTFRRYDTIIVLSGSCALHVRMHAAAFGDDGAGVAARTTEYCTYLHDVIGLDRLSSLGAERNARAAVHVGCHALRGLGLASPSELQEPRYDRVRAVLSTVRGLTFADLDRPDECCGFGGSFSVGEPAVSARMGLDRLADYGKGGAELLVSTDVSCLLHLDGLARRLGVALPVMHVAELLAGEVSA